MESEIISLASLKMINFEYNDVSEHHITNLNRKSIICEDFSLYHDLSVEFFDLKFHKLDSIDSV